MYVKHGFAQIDQDKGLSDMQHSRKHAIECECEHLKK